MNGDSPEPTPPPRKRLNWLRREGIDLGDAVIQFVAVVAGIVLGLFINQWTTHRRQAAAVHDAMQAIHAELTANRKALHKNAGYLYQMAATIQHTPANQNQPPRPCYLWHNWGGTSIVNLTDAAYQTAIATQALSHMPFKQAQVVAKVYGRQHARKHAISVIRNKILFTGSQTLDLCVMALGSIAHNEHLLDAAYAPLIGPDKTQWPTPLAITYPSTSTTTSK